MIDWLSAALFLGGCACLWWILSNICISRQSSRSNNTAQQQRQSKRRYGRYLTPSRMAAALGINRFCSRKELFEQLTGRVKRTTNGNEEAMRYGMEQEGTALEVYRQVFGVRVVDGNDYMLYSSELPWLRGKADGIIYDGRGLLEGIVEIKTRFGDDAVPFQQIPYYYVPQLLAYLHLLGAGAGGGGGPQYCDFMSFTRTGSNYFRIRGDQALWNHMVAVLQDFHRCLMDDVSPDDEHPLTAKIRAACENVAYTVTASPFEE